MNVNSWINKESKYIFSISKDETYLRNFEKKVCFGGLFVGLSSMTDYKHYISEDKEILVIGSAINLIDSSVNLQYLITKSNSIEDVIKREYNLGGKYLLLVRLGNDYYILGDATTSIPVFYNTVGNILCCYSDYVIAEEFGYNPDSHLLSIRNSGDIAMAMPYDVTAYKEIKQLLPNHYLHLNTNTSYRFVNSKKKQEKTEAKTAALKTIDRIKVLTDYYCSLYKPLCPITSGRDSRAVLAFLLKSNPGTKCYTIAHKEFSDDTQDIVIPKKLQELKKFEYKQVDDACVPEEIQKAVENVLGKGSFSQRTLYIAYTILKNFGNTTIINGDIIGQVGKCSLHRNIPEVLASPRYFRCKLHKHSHSSLQPLSDWIREIKESGEKVNLFDMFSIENRLGRWAGLENTIYNLLGVNYLNIFNSRSIIYEWTKAVRNERMKSMLHVSLIEEMDPQLLEVPFEKDESLLVKLSKSSWMPFYLASYLKFYINKMTFKNKE